MGEAGRQGE
jgi:hypothetical protein